jgi:hypothetical protein
MTSQSTPESEPPATMDEVDLELPTTNALPVLPTVFDAYRFIGEHLVTFIAVAALVAVGDFLMWSLLPSVPVYSDPPLPVVQAAIGIAPLLLASIIYAFVGIRWCRGIVLGRDRGSRRGLNASVIQFAVGMVLFGLLLEVLAALPALDASEPKLAIGDWVERELLLPAYFFWQIALALLGVLATSLLFPGLTAIAMGVNRPLRHGAALAWHNLRFVYAVFLVGLLPWMVLQGLELIPWLAVEMARLDAMPLQVTLEPFLILGLTLDAWITTTSIALGASAYRTLAHTNPSAETAEVFD